MSRPHRASGALALHVLEVMEAFATASDSRRVVEIATRPERPAPLFREFVAAALERSRERSGEGREVGAGAPHAG